MFGWFKRCRGTELYQQVKASLAEEGRWSVKKGVYGGSWLASDKKTRIDWKINSILDEWYVENPPALQSRESYEVATLLYKKLVYPALLQYEKELADLKREKTEGVLAQYREEQDGRAEM